MNVCPCPPGNFPAVRDVKCKENFGQIQKAIFVDLRNYGKGAVSLGFTPLGESIFEDAATMGEDSLIVDFLPTVDCPGVFDYVAISGANGIVSLLELFSGGRRNALGEDYATNLSETGNSPLIQISPFLEAPSQEPGEARTFGGGNDTPNGIEKFLGMGPSRFNAVMRGVPQKVIAQMKELICLSKAGQLGVILVNAEGYIEMLDTGKEIETVDGYGTYPAYWPIPIRGFQITDKVHGGFEEPDRNEISWDFLPNYSDNLVIVSDEHYLRGFGAKSILEMKNE